MTEYPPLFKHAAPTFVASLFCAFCLLASGAQALSVDKARVGVYPDKTRLVLELSAASDFRTFTLDTPYRLVIDMPHFAWNAGDFDRPAASGITGLRSGALKPGISRLVLDMSRPTSVESAFILPEQAGKPNRLVIDYISVSPAQFQAMKSRVQGRLNVDDPAHARNAPPALAAQTQAHAALDIASIPKPTAKPVSKPPAKPAYKPLIVIDPGHGGADPGAVGHNNIKEKNVVLALSKELKRQLESSGHYRAILTRKSDKFIKLSQRRKFARDRGADLFISLHADSLDKKNVRGASVYTLSEKASDKQTARLAARENKADLIGGIDLSVEDEEVASILVDLAMRDTTNQAKFFANKIVDTFKGLGLRVLDNPHRYAGFAVLKAPDVPSVLVEAGFMSNRREANLLNTSSHRNKLAKALHRGIDAYFLQVAKNQRL